MESGDLKKMKRGKKKHVLQFIWSILAQAPERFLKENPPSSVGIKQITQIIMTFLSYECV